MTGGPQSSDDCVKVCCFVSESRSRRGAKAGGAAGTAAVLRLKFARGATVEAIRKYLRQQHIQASRIYVGGKRAQKDDLVSVLHERHGRPGGQLEVKVVEGGARGTPRRPVAAGPGEGAREESAAAPGELEEGRLSARRGRLEELLLGNPGRVPVECRLASGGARGRAARVLAPPGMRCGDLADTCRALLAGTGGARAAGLPGEAALRSQGGAELGPGHRVCDFESLKSPDGVLRLSLTTARATGARRLGHAGPSVGPAGFSSEVGVPEGVAPVGSKVAEPQLRGPAEPGRGAAAGSGGAERLALAGTEAAQEQLSDLLADKIRKAIAGSLDSRQQAVLLELVQQVGAKVLLRELLELGRVQTDDDKQSVISESLVSHVSGRSGRSNPSCSVGGSVQPQQQHPQCLRAFSSASSSTDGDGLEGWFWMNPESPGRTP